jgi:hypothetical protein
VRLAAALRRTTMADFCRQVVLAEATRLTQGLPLEMEAEPVPTTKPTNPTIFPETGRDGCPRPAATPESRGQP